MEGNVLAVRSMHLEGKELRNTMCSIVIMYRQLQCLIQLIVSAAITERCIILFTPEIITTCKTRKCNKPRLLESYTGLFAKCLPFVKELCPPTTEIMFL
jgi:hypothetical protein